MTTRERSPLNVEMPFSKLDGFITPNDDFYVRDHFPVPRVDVKMWRLKVEGAVETPFEIGYEALLEMEMRTITATLECAGNSRAFLQPPPDATLWELGAVGNAEWTGVPLSAVLERAGMTSDAVDVILEGADHGEAEKSPRPAGTLHFSRSVPRRKACHDVLLALMMNGTPLSPAHGFPVRAIVPGWYAAASVKWLARIVVSDRPFAGYFQSIDYSYWERREGLPTLVPIQELQVKAEIARPAIGEVVPARSDYRMHGAAWTSEVEIVKVEISDNSGATWRDAKLIGQPVPNAWQLWEFDWRTPAVPGKVTLLARATDARGRTQPREHQADRGHYLISHCLPIAVDVR